MKKISLSLEQRKAMWGYLFILPWIIGFLLFFIQPLIETLVFSFNQVDIKDTGIVKTFVGWDNYKYALRVDPDYVRALTDSIKTVCLQVPVVLVFSFFVAVLLKQKFVGNKIAKAVFFLPVILASGIFMKMQLDNAKIDAAVGLTSSLNDESQTLAVLRSFKIEYYLAQAGLSEKMINYIVTPINQLFTVISSSGIQIFIFLAGLHSIPDTLYEAAYIEGATGWEAFWKITFPYVSPLILVNTVYSVIDNFTAQSNTAMTLILQTGIEKYVLGTAGAMSWIYFIIISGILGIVSFFISRKVFYQN